MLARRRFLATALNAIAAGFVATPALTAAQDANPLLATSPSSTGAPRTRGRSRGMASVTADAGEPRAVRSSGSPASRGRARGTRSVTADAAEPSTVRSSGSPASRGRRRLGITEQTVAGTASLR